MADSLGRGPRRGRARATSRASSARSSGVFDDTLHPYPHYGAHNSSSAPSGAIGGAAHHHTLRAVDSRFSLNEQFAATRRDYEFGFDDASSIFAPTLDLRDDKERDDTRSVGDGEVSSGEEEQEDDYYDLLCLPRGDRLTAQQIRAAYHRLFVLFHKDGHPPGQQRLAERYFDRAQRAFETLIEPYKRAEYDAGRQDWDLEDIDGEHDAREIATTRSIDSLMGQRWSDTASSTDLGVRFDISKTRGTSRRQPSIGFQPVDFAIGHSVTVGVPALGPILERKLRAIRAFIRPGLSIPSTATRSCVGASSSIKDLPAFPDDVFHFREPQFSIYSSVYGLVDDMMRTPLSLVADRNQPLQHSMPLYRAVGLAKNKLSPRVSARLRQEVELSPWENGQPRSVVMELEKDILPESGLAFRASHAIQVQHDDRPIYISGSIKMGGTRRWLRSKPRLGLEAMRAVGNGTAFICVDSGDWVFRQAVTCKLLNDFARLDRTIFSYTELPLRVPPSCELGFTTADVNLDNLDKENSRTGLARLDLEMEHSEPSWTASTTATPESLEAYLRYGLDVHLPNPPRSISRIELELSANTHGSHYLALRNLWPISPRTSLGLEFSLSTSAFHLSFHFSRLTQRVALPFFVSPLGNLTSETLFWAGVVPFLAFAGAQLLTSRRKATALRRRRLDQLSPAALARRIARQRAEADELTVLMAGPVEARQKMERQRGGLVILSAKYGVKDERSTTGWTAGEEVSDVTIAVAALVDNGHLIIPRGVRKDRLLGFWDPVPLGRKTLFVRYMLRGRESIVEVQGREELALPPRDEV